LHYCPTHASSFGTDEIDVALPSHHRTGLTGSNMRPDNGPGALAMNINGCRERSAG
jgi:hypothetical protein